MAKKEKKMNKNIRIARQLVKIAKELVSSRSRKAFDNIWKDWFGIANQDFEVVGTYDELVSKCQGFDTSSCCLLNNEQGKTYFDMYGAPFYVYCKNNKCVIMHLDSKQLKDCNDIAVTGNKPGDSEVLNQAAYILFAYGRHQYCKCADLQFEEAISLCTGDFKALIPYLQKAQEKSHETISEEDFQNSLPEWFRKRP